ncbi:hypothetical protein FQR65_LT09642 [Abscondita terminalis]|nr:hypothetical protein FQR65_LT09642 [Abscondita terminalis]
MFRIEWDPRLCTVIAELSDEPSLKWEYVGHLLVVGPGRFLLLCTPTGNGKECNKIRGSQTSGVGTDGVYKPTWWCFDLLLFLNDADPVRPSTTNLEVTQGSTNEDDGNVIFEGTMDQLQHQLQSPSSSSPATPEPPTKKRKTPIQSNALEIMKIASERLAQGRKEVEDDISTFGLMVATELRKIKKKDILRKLKKDIFNLILDMQQLDEDQEY